MEQKHSYLALGDSYTIGEAVPEENRWPVLLADLLNEAGKPFDQPRIIAKTGWTTSELATAIQQADIRDTFDLVTLLIGVNNQYRGNDPEEYRNEFRDLLKRAVSFAGGKTTHVVVVSIPDWGVTPFAEGRDRTEIAAKIDLFNTINRKESEQQQVRYVDITAGSRQAAADSELTASDGLHPSGKMYKQWAEAVYSAVASQY